MPILDVCTPRRAQTSKISLFARQQIRLMTLIRIFIQSAASGAVTAAAVKIVIIFASYVDQGN